MLLTFTKENDQWFTEVPEWTGAREELEMVCEADTALDIIAQGRSQISLDISEIPSEDTKIFLALNREDGGGGWYDLTGEDMNFEVWLCHVTKFVFDGRLPEKLFITL